MTRRLAATLTLCLLSAVACDSSTPPFTRPAATGPLCGFRHAPPATYRHVIWLLQENHSENDVIGNGDLPYLNDTLAAQCGLATNYHNVGHPSLPNYLGLTSGMNDGVGVADNCQPADCPQHQRTIFDQVRARGGKWRQYAESQQGNCDPTKDPQYEPEHAVPVYFPALRADCQRWDVPLGDPAGGVLRSDLNRGWLPTFAFLSPDGDHESGADGDGWLGDWITLIAATPEYRSGDTAIFVTWDEGSGSDSRHGERCADAAHADARNYPSCWVATLVITPSTRPGTRSSTDFSHYSLLRTTEDMLGIRVHLGHAGDPTTASMRAAFHA